MLLSARRALAARRYPSGHFSFHLATRRFSRSPCSKISLSLPIPNAADLQGGGQDSLLDKIRRQKYDDLITSFRRGYTNPPNPNVVWACYTDLLQHTPAEEIPLDIHREVLRKCTKDHGRVRSDVERIVSYGKMRGSLWSANPHQHEKRFLSVLSNIRSAGEYPDVDDYNFILQQYAAVGHHVGAAGILQEMEQTGLELRTKSYGLCLQAIARRLTLPRPKEDDNRIQEECAQLCLHVLNAIRARLRSIPSVCLDLTLRIMKDTGNTQIFNDLLKAGYGVDLVYPDRLPLGWERVNRYEPLSTATLTTVVDHLGRKGNISKMVTAFEVLSAPSTVTESQYRQIAFDDDDDDNFPVPLSQTTRSLPSAQPNITTYNTLILRCAQASHTVFAKHYVLQTMELYKETSAKLREEVQTKPLTEILRPGIQVNVDTFRPILGLANRDRDIALLRWVMKQHRVAWKTKREDCRFFSEVLEREIQKDPFFIASSHENGQFQQASHNGKDNVRISPSAEPAGNFFTSSMSSSPLSSQIDQHFDSNGSADINPLDMKVDTFHTPLPPKPFDLAFYVQSLRDDARAMKDLDGRIGTAMSRLHVRMKEKLGRRIWKGKNVYLKSQSQRVAIARADWSRMVNFKPAGKNRLEAQESKLETGKEGTSTA